MEFVIAFNIVVTAAWWIGASFIALSLVSVGVMLALRSWSASSHKRRQIVNRRWETTLFKAVDNEFNINNRRQLTKKQLPHFLHDWNYLHESISGDSKNGLNDLGGSLRLHTMTRELLTSPFVDKRLMAVNTLGNLGNTASYPSIEKLIADRDPVISSWAWRALFRIDVNTTLEKHLDKIATRRDWSPIFVAKVLKEIDCDTLSTPLCELVEKLFAENLEERQMSRLISYLAFANFEHRNPLVSMILLDSNEKEVLIACLRLVNSDDDLPRIRELINDERWEVRLQVVLTLGRLGHKRDIDLLIAATDDLDWWVRYRAASMLISMPGMTEAKVEKLSRTLPSPFSRDILRQVMTEMQLLCFRQTTLTLSR